MSELKRHYKLYKSGSKWVAAAIVSAGAVVLSGNATQSVAADTTTPSQSSATRGAVKTDASSTSSGNAVKTDTTSTASESSTKKGDVTSNTQQNTAIKTPSNLTGTDKNLATFLLAGFPCSPSSLTGTDKNGIQTNWSRDKSADTGNSDSNSVSNEAGKYWPNTQGNSLKDYSKTTITDFTKDQTFDLGYNPTPVLRNMSDLSLYIRGQKVDLSNLVDDDSLNDQYTGHNSKGHSRLISTSDLGENTYFWAKNVFKIYNEITHKYDRYDLKWTLQSVNYGDANTKIALGIKGSQDGGGTQLLNIGSGWQLAHLGNFFNTHLQFFKEENESASKENPALAIANADVTAKAVSIHMGFSDIDANEAVQLTSGVIKKVYVDKFTQLAYQDQDGYLSVTRKYNDSSDVRINERKVTFLMEMDVPVEGFDLSVATIGNQKDSSNNYIHAQGSKVAPSLLPTMKYTEPLVIAYNKLDCNGNTTTESLQTKTFEGLIGDKYTVDSTGNTVDTSAPLTITDSDGNIWKLVSEKTQGNPNGSYVDGINEIDYYYQIFESKKINEIIHYVYEDHTTAHKDYVAKPVEFTRKVSTDAVTGEKTYGSWSANQSFAAVTSPTIKGYTPDKAEIEAQTVSGDDNDVVKTVTYKANTQKLKVVFIDDTTGQVLKTVTKTGVTNANAGYNTQSDIQSYEGQHYVLVSDSSHGANLVFDNEDNTDQAYEVHLKHGTHQIDEHHTITQTVHYIATDHAGVPDDHTVSVQFDRDGYNDEVTGDDHWNAWKQGSIQTFAEVPTPKKAGYTPDKPSVPETVVHPLDHNQTIDVTYTPDTQNVIVTFIDDTDNGKALKTVTKTGPTNSNAGYTTVDDINMYKGQHYVLVSDQTHGQSITFDTDTNADQRYEVHLKHGTHQINDHRTITETVHYKMTDGTTAPADHTAKIEFSRDGFNDEVTGTDHWNAWTPSSTQQFDAVHSPDVKGYTPNTDQINAVTVNPDSQSIERTVTYTPDAQKLDVTFIDDTTGEALKTVVKNGVTNADANYSTKSDIQNYESQHYILVSDSSKGDELVFDNDDAVDQHYEVHLKHATHVINEHHVINETVHYKMSDGSKVPDDHTANVQFDRDGFNDEVTGTDHWNDWRQGDTQTFAGVLTPVKKGYTPDIQLVDAITVNPTDQDIKRTVTYTPDAQKLDITFIDDTDGKTLKTVVKNGVTNADANYSTKSDIQNYESQHYVLVSDSSKGAELVFDNDDAVDQHYEVHLKHATHAIDEHHVINETVHYKMSDGTKAPDDYQAEALSFSRDGFNDEVTGIDHWNAWAPKAEQTFGKVVSPLVAGYTPDIDQINAQTVKPTDHDLEFTVTYTPNVQIAHVKYIDDTDHKVLTQDDLNGRTGETSGYHTTDRITEFKGQHYVFVSDNYPATGMTFDNNDRFDQIYEVHFKHGTRTDEQDVQVPRTIKYVYQNGQQAQPDHSDALSFHETKVVDLVDGHTVSDDWTPAQDFETVMTPEIQGYTPDHASVSNTGIAHDHSAIVETVTYNPDAQKAVVKYIDDTTGEQLEAKDLAGVSDQSTGYNTKETIDGYVARHYDLISDGTNGKTVVFDHDDDADQSYEVHLKHGTEPANESRIKKIMVHYQYADGLARSGKAHDDQTVTNLTFKRTGTHDLVTDKIAWNAWNHADQTFSAIDSPAIQGYTPDRTVVDNIKVNPDSHDLTEVTVTYTADAQKLTVNFIDDTTGQTLKTVTKTGYSDEDAGYNTKSDIQDFISKHYDLVSDQTNGENLIFDHNDDVDQVYEVHLSHHTHQINEQHTVTETVHYQYADGLAHSGKAVDDFNALPLSFSRDGFNDEVTGTDHWNAWTPSEQQTFVAVPSPVIEGYTPDQREIGVINVVPTSQNIEKTVTYNADSQKLSVDFIDDTTGKTLKTVAKTGYSDEDAGYNTKLDIQDFISKHYDLVSDQTNGKRLVFDHDDNIDQHYEVHLSHHTHPINEQHTITETVHYQYADGLARSGKAADDFNANALKFSRDGFNDEVTGVDHWNAWTPSDQQIFAAVQSPVIEGYTPDQSEIGAINVVPTSQSIEKTVTYTADAQKLTVNFIDDTTGQTLKTVTKTGYSDEDADCNTKSDIQNFVGQHYDLVSDATKGADLVFDHDDAVDQVYTVHLTHHLTPISDHQVVNETIHYVYADGLARTGKAVDDYIATPFEFNRTGKHDDVTGTDSWNAWIPGSASFATVQSPAIQGYTPDHAQIDAVSVDANSQDIVKTVTYSADQQKMTVDFIDDTDNGKVLKTVTKTGGSDEAVGYNTKADIQTFVDGHYKLDHDTSNGENLVFDHDDAVDQHYEVHLTHETVPINEATSTSQVIHYQLADGTPVAKDYTAKVDFSRDGFKDLVTNADHWNAWTPNATQTFDVVMSPAKAGYTPDHVQVDAVTVEPHHADLETTVTYLPDDQKASVKYIDDVTGKTLQTKELTGVSDETSAYTTESTINQYVGQHYKLVSDQTNGQPVVFDHDDDKDQAFEVHLTHTYQDVSQEHQVHQTIHYQYADGKQAQPDYTAKVLAFSRTGIQDLVTENIQWNAWTPDQTFAAVNTPALNGYTPDVQTAAPVKVSHDSKDIEQTVVYHADDQTILVNYIDDDTQSTLKTDSIIGKTAQTSDYTTKKSLDQYKGQHYDVVSDDTNGDTLKFDTDSTKVQTYNVHLKHQHQVASDKSTVHQTVHYVYQDGKQAAKDYTAMPIEFTRTGDTDLVTGKTTWNAWTPDTGTLIAVISPVIVGYTPSRAMINRVDVHAGDKDLDTTVTYVPDHQVIVVNYIDQTAGKMLKTDTLNGLSDQTSGYTTKSQIDSYVGQHYKLISDATDGQTLTFDHDDQETQTYDVVLSHQTEASHRTHEVHEIVDYVYADGSQASKSFTAQPIVFSQTGVHDLVTNITDWNGEWTKPQAFAAVESPKIIGFTASKPEVKATEVNYQSSDIHELVIYAANAQTAQIKYIDDVTGNMLETDDANGHFNESIIFSHNVNDQINKFKQAHYKLVSNNFDGQKYQADNTKNVYEVHLTHEYQKVHATDAVAETVKFQYADGSQAQPTKTQTVNFGRDGIKDLVTGTTAWMPVDSQTLVAVDVPVLDGYTADTDQVPAVKVNFGDNDITKVVTYTANDQVAEIKIIDDTTGNVLNTQSATGKFGTEIQFKQNPDQQVIDLQAQHYKLVSDNFNGQKYQSNNAKNQFEIHVKHQMMDVQRTDKVTETVRYQDNHGNMLHPASIQTKMFTEHGITDQVTGKTVWTPAKSQTMDAVSAPEITGYTPNKQSVPATSVNFGDKDINDVIVYAPVSEAANIKYIDDTTGKTLLDDQTTGDFGSQIKFDHDPVAQINQYEGQGYKLVSNSYGKTAHQFSATQSENNFEVHFTHGTQNVSRTNKVTETVKYQFADGSQAQKDYVQTAKFTQHGVQDLVTKTTVWTSSDPQTFVSVDTPKIIGYTADIQNVPAVTVNFGDEDIIKVVTYKANDQLAGIKYIDDTTGKTLDTEAASGKFGTRIEFMRDPSSMIQKFEGQGYKFKSNSFNGQKYQADNSKNQFEVHFTHGTQNVSRTNKVMETVKYQFADGRQAQKDYVQTAKFTQHGVQDLVTKTTVWTSSDPQTFVSVDTPHITGYTADVQNVPVATVNFGDADITKVVTYAKNAPTITTESKTIKETIHYVYKDGTKAHDDYVAKPVEFTREVSTDAVTGEKTYGSWSADPSFAAVTSPAIKGYTPDKAEIGSQTVSGDDSDLVFTVVYAKNDPTITTESKTIKETIHYVYKDGTKAHDDYVAKPVEFTREVSTDAVTGEKTYGSWSADPSFAAVTSPAIKGYTPDKAEIGSQTVSGDDSDLVFTVVYAKNDPTITTESKTIKETIHYVYKDGTKAHDDYVAKPVEFTREVSTDAVTGEKTYGSWSADPSFAAVTSPAIKGYTPDKAEIGSQTVSGDDSDLVFTVVYTKDAPTKPVNPSQPTTPAKPVNPSQPTTPAKPVNPSQPTTPTKPVQAGQAAATNFVNQRLPQTGETDQQHMTLSGVLLLAMSSLLGLFGMTKRQRKE